MNQRDRDAFEEVKKPLLPIYEASNSKDFPGFMIVFCPREDCAGTKHGRPFVVHKATWMRPQRLLSIKTQLPFVMIGRTCPYCMRVARLPKRSDVV